MSDYFDRLGLPRRFALDAGELERAYLTRSRAVHPDYHLAGTGGELAASLEASAALNEAYTTLRDPFTRAEYLLKVEGGPSASDQKQMPPAFLMEMLEAREQVEQTRGNAAETARLDAAFHNQYDGLITQTGELFAQYEQLPADSPTRPNLLTRIRGLLNAAKYVRGLIRDLHDE